MSMWNNQIYKNLNKNIYNIIIKYQITNLQYQIEKNEKKIDLVYFYKII